jgi:hypothetical protein
MSRDSQKPAPPAAAGQAAPSQATAGQAPAGQADPRGERLARALRDNLKKRKAQQRARRADPAPGAVGGEDSPGGGA